MHRVTSPLPTVVSLFTLSALCSFSADWLDWAAAAAANSSIPFCCGFSSTWTEGVVRPTWEMSELSILLLDESEVCWLEMDAEVCGFETITMVWFDDFLSTTWIGSAFGRPVVAVVLVRKQALVGWFNTTDWRRICLLSKLNWLLDCQVDTFFCGGVSDSKEITFAVDGLLKIKDGAGRFKGAWLVCSFVFWIRTPTLS